MALFWSPHCITHDTMAICEHALSVRALAPVGLDLAMEPLVNSFIRQCKASRMVFRDSLVVWSWTRDKYMYREVITANGIFERSGASSRAAASGIL